MKIRALVLALVLATSTLSYAFNPFVYSWNKVGDVANALHAPRKLTQASTAIIVTGLSAGLSIYGSYKLIRHVLQKIDDNKSTEELVSKAESALGESDHYSEEIKLIQSIKNTNDPISRLAQKDLLKDSLLEAHCDCTYPYIFFANTLYYNQLNIKKIITKLERRLSRLNFNEQSYLPILQNLIQELTAKENELGCIIKLVGSLNEYRNEKRQHDMAVSLQVITCLEIYNLMFNSTTITYSTPYYGRY